MIRGATHASRSHRDADRLERAARDRNEDRGSSPADGEETGGVIAP